MGPGPPLLGRVLWWISPMARHGPPPTRHSSKNSARGSTRPDKSDDPQNVCCKLFGFINKGMTCFDHCSCSQGLPNHFLRKAPSYRGRGSWRTQRPTHPGPPKQRQTRTDKTTFRGETCGSLSRAERIWGQKNGALSSQLGIHGRWSSDIQFLEAE